MDHFSYIHKPTSEHMAFGNSGNDKVNFL